MIRKDELDGRALCIIGPGGDFRREISDSGDKLLDLQSRNVDESTVLALARMLGRRRDLARGLLDQAADEPAVSPQIAKRLSAAAVSALPPVIIGSLSAFMTEEWTDATEQVVQEGAVADSKTVAGSDVHSGLYERARLCPDDAGARRRIRRKQSHGIRAHLGLAAEGLSQACQAQGTLFAT